MKYKMTMKDGNTIVFESDLQGPELKAQQDRIYRDYQNRQNVQNYLANNPSQPQVLPSDAGETPPNEPASFLGKPVLPEPHSERASFLGKPIFPDLKGIYDDYRSFESGAIASLPLVGDLVNKQRDSQRAFMNKILNPAANLFGYDLPDTPEEQAAYRGKATTENPWMNLAGGVGGTVAGGAAALSTKAGLKAANYLARKAMKGGYVQRGLRSFGIGGGLGAGEQTGREIINQTFEPGDYRGDDIAVKGLIGFGLGGAAGTLGQNLATGVDAVSKWARRRKASSGPTSVGADNPRTSFEFTGNTVNMTDAQKRLKDTELEDIEGGTYQGDLDRAEKEFMGRHTTANQRTKDRAFEEELSDLASKATKETIEANKASRKRAANYILANNDIFREVPEHLKTTNNRSTFAKNPEGEFDVTGSVPGQAPAAVQAYRKRLIGDVPRQKFVTPMFSDNGQVFVNAVKNIVQKGDPEDSALAINFLRRDLDAIEKDPMYQKYLTKYGQADPRQVMREIDAMSKARSDMSNMLQKAGNVKSEYIGLMEDIEFNPSFTPGQGARTSEVANQIANKQRDMLQQQINQIVRDNLEKIANDPSKAQKILRKEEETLARLAAQNELSELRNVFKITRRQEEALNRILRQKANLDAKIAEKNMEFSIRFGDYDGPEEMLKAVNLYKSVAGRQKMLAELTNRSQPASNLSPEYFDYIDAQLFSSSRGPWLEKASRFARNRQRNFESKAEKQDRTRALNALFSLDRRVQRDFVNDIIKGNVPSKPSFMDRAWHGHANSPPPSKLPPFMSIGANQFLNNQVSSDENRRHF